MSGGISLRRVEPELLDALAHDDPAAQASRRDLRRINRLMFHTAIVAHLLRRHVTEPPRRIVEIGCGDGHTTLSLARKMAPAWPGVTLTLVDRQDLVSGEVRQGFAALGWSVESVTADVFDWLRHGETQDLALANLFLHHFPAEDLRVLLHGLSGLSHRFVAAEPRRSGFALAASSMLAAIGANHVTRHDAPTSVRAGFTGRDLTVLWPGGAAKVLCERAVGPFTHVFAARGQGGS